MTEVNRIRGKIGYPSQARANLPTTLTRLKARIPCAENGICSECRRWNKRAEKGIKGGKKTLDAKSNSH